MSSYDPHKKYKRVGECNHCGVCCVGCKFQRWKAVRDIKAGETVDSPADFISECLIHDHPELPEYQTTFIGKGCDRFPSHPLSTPEKCSFKWVEE
jgi:hypothetical protein